MVLAHQYGLVGGAFLYFAWRLLRTGEDVVMRKSARALFNFSLGYLFVLFLALLVDNLLLRYGVMA